MSAGLPELGLRHVTVATDRFATSLDFYDTVLTAAGLLRLHELVDEEQDDPAVEAAAWGVEDAQACLWLVSTGTPTTGLHLSLAVATRAVVDAVAEAAVRHGGSVRTAPRPWPIYRGGRYLTEVRDPAGNVVEAVADG